MRLLKSGEHGKQLQPRLLASSITENLGFFCLSLSLSLFFFFFFFFFLSLSLSPPASLSPLDLT